LYLASYIIIACIAPGFCCIQYLHVQKFSLSGERVVVYRLTRVAVEDDEHFPINLATDQYNMS